MSDFYDVLAGASTHVDPAMRAAAAVYGDMCDRMGLRQALDRCDDETLTDILTAFECLIRAEYNK